MKNYLYINHIAGHWITLKKILTPNIDELAAEGMRFTQAYAGSTVCTPSRCSLMTGLHNGNNRIRDNLPPDIFLSPDDFTIAEHNVLI